MPSLGHEKFSLERRERYLDLLRAGGRRYRSARAVGLHPSTVTAYRRRHPNFAKEEAIAEAESIEIVEDSLFRAARRGNVAAIQFFLTNRSPATWAERKNVRTEVVGEGGGPVEVTSSQYVRSILASDEATALALQLLDTVAESTADS